MSYFSLRANFAIKICLNKKKKKKNIEKASHTFVVYHLLIDIVHFVWSFVRAGRQVIQFNK